MNKKFSNAEKVLNEKIEYWYRRMAVNNNISFDQAKTLLNRNELQEFKWTVEEYIEKGIENSLNKQWIKELENASARVHIQRLEALKLEARHQLEVLYQGYENDFEDLMWHTYQDSYYKSIFEVQKGTGVAVDFARIDKDYFQKVMRKPWSIDGTNFSESIWKNKTKLINTVDQQITHMAITGESPKKLASKLAKTMETSNYNARRLLYTESAFFCEEAKQNSYKELGVKKYQILVALDDRTCDICGALDKEVVDVKDGIVGENKPPFHPNCRCTTVPYYEGDEEIFADVKRASRDPTTGKTVRVFNSNTTWEQWREKVYGKDSKSRSK